MRRIHRAAFVSFAALLAVSCDGPGTAGMSEVKVGSHVFDVPEAHLVADISFLPDAQNDALGALLDPGAPQPERINFTVEPAARLCAYRTPPVIDQLPRACAVARGEAARAPLGDVTKKPRFPGDPTQYDYRGGDDGVVASCADGSCNAIYAWRDLIWSANLPEARIGELEKIIAQVEGLLDQWSTT